MVNKGSDNRLLNKTAIIYLLKFGISFCILYYGTIAVIGVASPTGKFHSSFIDQYLNYPDWLKNSLIQASKGFMSLFGYKTYFVLPNHLRLINGSGVNIAYDCFGYGVSSFWVAFVFANTGNFKRKCIWIVSGVLALWCINVLRISLLLMAIFNHWEIPLFEHHTWFNIAAYGLIFLMIYFYDRSSRVAKS